MVSYISEIKWDHKSTLKMDENEDDQAKKKKKILMEAEKLNGNVKTSMQSKKANCVPFPRMCLSF